MSSMSDVFRSRFLSAPDLRGQEVQLVIEKIEIEVIIGRDRKEKKRPVLSFVGTDKQLCSNVTNAQEMAAVFGDEFDRWLGKTIVLYPTTTQYQGGMTPCIRVRIPRQPSNPAPVAQFVPAPAPSSDVNALLQEAASIDSPAGLPF